MTNTNLPPGFSAPAITVYDVSDPLQPVVVKATMIEETSPGSFQVSFEPASPEAEYLAISGAADRPSASLATDSPSSLKQSRNGADYLILTPEALLTGAEALARYRGAEYLTQVVDVEDVYDEFNHGIADPDAIQEFVSYTQKHWRLAPSHLVLAGKGTMDPKDYKGLGTNLFPILMATTPHGLFPSDNRYGDVVGDDGVPELAVGRIPVLSSEELLAYVEKLRDYETGSGDWTATFLLLSDNPDEAGDFTEQSDRVADLLNGTVNKIYHDGQVAETREQLSNALNKGAALFNYVGHAGIHQLGHEAFLREADVAEMANSDRLPVFVAMSCYVGLGTFPVQGTSAPRSQGSRRDGRCGRPSDDLATP